MAAVFTGGSRLGSPPRWQSRGVSFTRAREIRCQMLELAPGFSTRRNSIAAAPGSSKCGHTEKAEHPIAFAQPKGRRRLASTVCHSHARHVLWSRATSIMRGRDSTRSTRHVADSRARATPLSRFRRPRPRRATGFHLDSTPAQMASNPRSQPLAKRGQATPTVRHLSAIGRRKCGSWISVHGVSPIVFRCGSSNTVRPSNGHPGGTAATIQDETRQPLTSDSPCQKRQPEAVMIRAKPYTKATLTTHQAAGLESARAMGASAASAGPQWHSTAAMEGQLDAHEGAMADTEAASRSPHREQRGVDFPAVVAAGRGRTRNASRHQGRYIGMKTCPR